MDSAIYKGWVRHRRYRPKAHEFRYQVFMMYLYLDEIEQLHQLSRLFSKRRFSVFRFKREDYHGDPEKKLVQCVKDTVQASLGFRPTGRVAMLTNLRMFGFVMNPITTYYCFNKNGELASIVAEVNNTPWNERRAYVIPAKNNSKTVDSVFEKDFTVSPFNPIDMYYRWRSTLPGNNVVLHIDTKREGSTVVDATLCMESMTFNANNLLSIVIAFPIMTVKVIVAIYWQALRLALKGVPFLGKGHAVTDYSKGVRES